MELQSNRALIFIVALCFFAISFVPAEGRSELCKPGRFWDHGTGKCEDCCDICCYKRFRKTVEQCQKNCPRYKPKVRQKKRKKSEPSTDQTTISNYKHKNNYINNNGINVNTNKNLNDNIDGEVNNGRTMDASSNAWFVPLLAISVAAPMLFSTLFIILVYKRKYVFRLGPPEGSVGETENEVANPLLTIPVESNVSAGPFRDVEDSQSTSFLVFKTPVQEIGDDFRDEWESFHNTKPKTILC